MELTARHIADLVLYRYYTDHYTYTSLSTPSSVLEELISEGLVEVDRLTEYKMHITITNRGRQELYDIGSVVIVSAIFELDKPHLLHLCDDALTLADLPALMASSNEQARAFARKTYQKWT